MGSVIRLAGWRREPESNVHSRHGGWPRGDLARLYRVARVLRRCGIALETESGVSDEGEPWFVLCHAESADVIAHFARIGGTYIVCIPFLNNLLSGRTMRSLVGRFLDRRPALTRHPDRPVTLHAVKKRSARRRRRERLPNSSGIEDRNLSTDDRILQAAVSSSSARLTAVEPIRQGLRDARDDMGTVIRFPDGGRTAHNGGTSGGQSEPTRIIILPVIRIERENNELAARRLERDNEPCRRLRRRAPAPSTTAEP